MNNADFNKTCHNKPELYSKFQPVYSFTRRVKEVQKLFKETSWGGNRSEREIERMLRNSIASVGLEPRGGGELVAYARAVGDGVFKAVIEDVIVTEALRNQGVGRILMQTLLEMNDVGNAEEVELYCDPKRKRFYEENGFAVVADQLFMRSFGLRHS